MQENNFEKRVQQQMEELRLRPSDAVWEKVEEEIRKKKKRRVVFFIFLLAGLSLLGYSGYFLFNKAKPNLAEQNTTLTDKKESIKNSQPGAGTANANRENENNKKPEPGKENQVSSKEEKNITIEEKTNSTGTNDVAINKKETTVNEENIVLKDRTRRTVKTPAGEKLSDKAKSKYTAANNKTQGQTGGKSDPQKKNSDIPVISKADEVSVPVVAEKDLAENKEFPVEEKEVQGKDIQTTKDSTAKEEVAANKEVPAATPKKKQPPKINWGMELSYGVSANREDAFLGGQKSMADRVYSSPQSNAGSPLVSTTMFYSPSSIKSGAAFRAGLVGEMKISRKSSVSLGLRYAYFSNSIKVGSYKDTAVSFTNSFSQDVNVRAIYRGVQQKEYTNRFHFIQLPLQYQWQLNKGIKIPILWNVGATVGYLISTNGLVYDTAANGIYYHDKKAFNKLNWNLNTGFSFRLGNKGKLQWSLGPELSVGMNKLTKNDYTKKQYLLYGGMTGRIIFTKKNK